MRLFINSLAASAGGGLTYIRNVLPHLAAKPNLKVTVALTTGLLQGFQFGENIDVVEVAVRPTQRFWFEQTDLPDIIRGCQADVLLSTGNVAVMRSRVPQILLSRNSIYLCPEFYSDLLSRREYRAWFDTHVRAVIVRKSIGCADLTVAPSEAFAADLTRWAGREVLAIHHGFDHDMFNKQSVPLPQDVEDKLRGSQGSLKLLFVSHYNYYRNFETLIRALPLLRRRLANRSVKLLLTCNLLPGKNPGAYRTESAATLIQRLGLVDMIVELGSIPYEQLSQIYARADVYVTPAYTETFAHPLVEAMASGVPVVASDLPVHREICGEAAGFFPAFSPEDLAEKVGQVASVQETARRMAAAGLERSQHFSWKAHVEKILEQCERLVGSSLLRTGHRKGSAMILG
jgi:glycosyltransferase involved in cell wall biosynthesis